MVQTALEAFLSDRDRPTPFLVLDPAFVARRYAELAQAFPGAEILYAVKACPHPAVLRTLVDAGAGFDAASTAEVALCVEAGADPARICAGNPVRGAAATAACHAAGVCRYVTDSLEDLDEIAVHAPGAEVLVRVLVDDTGSATPFFGKFGATPAVATDLLRACASRGLVATGVTFHAGSQQTRPATYAAGVATALAVAREAGLERPVLDIGGGLPVAYRAAVPAWEEFAAAVGGHDVRLVLEPGRALVAEAGMLRTSVLRVSRRPGVDHRRWVYLDAGRYQGLAETENEAIDYPLRVPGRDGPAGPVVIAGPTCDGDDVLYRRTPYALPLSLRAGDHVDLLHAGAYTASYASVGFNGFAPLPVHLAPPQR
ncbi:MAG: ornithine decarboxylase [Pseudonocardia sp. SCN 73-27]|uniref:type III PLP-dependent enzyme n=1 Tax=unclassified Pseudonocardia TaxID=2619320 RepID=UPI00086CB498|nr:MULTISPECIES: type III PLP-dependent enzyme [unclassified Pseudonocardia]ODU22370.1 MAG: ornithine decarboxylase [Pseudonocardia sp. SCN 72-51]ODV07059.1 MAG: ornithine decarboxylase [Pseudonocardia sp. SCN 73-27]